MAPKNPIDLLNETPWPELSYLIGRYAGPQNALLAEKKFGFSIPKDLAQKVFNRREREFLDEQIEKILLTDET